MMTNTKLYEEILIQSEENMPRVWKHGQYEEFESDRIVGELCYKHMINDVKEHGYAFSFR